MNITLRPRVNKGLYYNQLYKNSKSSYVVLGNKLSGASLIIEDKNIVSINLLIKEFNGESTLEEISNKINIPINELLSIVNLLRSKKIVSLDQEMEETSIANFNEAERFSFKLFEKSLIGLKLNPALLANLIKIFKLFLVINVILFFTLFIKNHNKVSILRLIMYKNSYLKSYILVNLFMVVSFIFHEFAHLVMAQRYEAESEKFVFILYWYFIPMMYLKNKNLYALERKKLLKVLLAGITMNIFIFLFSLNIFYMTNNYIFLCIALSNFKMVYVNLVPLSLSDGYFIFTILFGEPNLRKGSYKIIGNLWSISTIKKHKRSEILYSVLSFTSSMFLFTSEIIWLISSLQILNGLVLMISIISIVLIYLIFYIWWIRKKLAS